MQQIKKHMFGQLNKGVERTDRGTLFVRGLYTSDNVDEVGDVITKAATERALPKYRQWGNVRLQHTEKPVAKVRRIGVEDGLAWNEAEIEVIDPEAIFMVENGLLVALSVGILVSKEDCSFDTKGCMVINDYTLAEISLVDHPANYDARLQPVSNGLRDLVRQYGMTAVALSMQTLIETPSEVIMSEEKALTPAEEVEVVVETPAIEKELPVEPAEERVELGQVFEEKVIETVEEKELGDMPEAGEVESPNDDMQEQAAIVSSLTTITAMLTQLAQQVAEVASAIKALAEVQIADVQVESEASKAIEEAVVEEPVKEAAIEPEIQAGTPVNRTAAVPATELPQGTAAEQKSAPVADLRKALATYLTHR